MFNKQVLEVTAKNTLFHRLDARTKLLFAAAVSMGVLLIDSPLTLYFIFLFVLFMHFIAKSSFSKWLVLMLIILIGVWGSVVSQAMFYNQLPRTPILCLLAMDESRLMMSDGVYLYREGIQYGALQALRAATMVSAGMLLCWTTDQRDLLKGFIYWKMPYELAFMSITSLRFLPDIVTETMTVMTAQKLRGAKPFRSLKINRLIHTLYQILYPILARTIKRAGTLALSVESRGFGRSLRVQTLKLWAGKEKICAAGIGILICILFGVKLIYWLQFNGVLYLSSFRPVYDLVKIWL